MCNKLLQWKLKMECKKHQTSEDTQYSKNTLHGECPLTSTTAETSAATPSVSRVNFHTCTFTALLHTTTPVQTTKFRCVDRDDRLVQAYRAPDLVTDANVYVRSLNKMNPSFAVDMDCCAAANIKACTVSVDVTTSDCSSQAA